MVVGKQGSSLICGRCLLRFERNSERSLLNWKDGRYFTKSSHLPQNNGEAEAAPKESGREKEEQGGMSRRLSQMTEESIEGGCHSMRKAIEEGGFSEELKKRLGQRILDSTFRNEHPAAFAELDMPVSPDHAQLPRIVYLMVVSLVQAQELVLWPPHSLG